MNEKLAKFIRTVTVAPIMAGILVTLLHFNYDAAFLNNAHYFMALFFLSILPILAYPVSLLVPKIRRMGRRGQRNLAIVFAVIGYLFGTVYCLLFGYTAAELTIYLTYLFSGVAIALLSFLFHVKGSGHACGVSGPVAMLAAFLGMPYLFGYILLAFVFKSSVVLKRHTPAQLVIGSVVPVLCMAAAMVNVLFIV